MCSREIAFHLLQCSQSLYMQNFHFIGLNGTQFLNDHDQFALYVVNATVQLYRIEEVVVVAQQTIIGTLLNGSRARLFTSIWVELGSSIIRQPQGMLLVGGLLSLLVCDDDH